MNEKYIKQLYDFIGGKDAGFDYDAFKNDISTNEEYNKEIFDYAYGEQEGIDYNAYAFDTGLKKKEQSDSNSSQEPTPSSEATEVSPSSGTQLEEGQNDLFADVAEAQSAQDYKEPIVEVPNRLVAKYGRQMEADEYRQAPIGMPLELAQLANKGAARLFGSVAEAPEFIYNTLAAPQNYIAEKTGLPIGTDFESVVESVGGKDAYEKVKGLWRQQAEQELKNIDDVYSKSVSELFSNGDIADGLKALSGQVAETLPYTLGIVGASIAGAPPIPLMVGTSVVSGSGKYSDLEKSEVSEGQKLLNAWGTGLAEGVSEALGTASIARGVKTIFSTMGVKAGKEESKKFAVKSITDAMKKYGAAPVGAITEGIEEMASQFAENAADISTGVDPDRKLISGLSDAFIVGVGAGGVISAPAQLKQLTDRISSKDVELMSILDEVQLEKLSNDIDQDVKDGIVSQEEGERLKTDLSQGIDAVSKTLPTDSNEKRAEDANLIKEKAKLESELEGVDKVIADSSPQAKRITEIDESLSKAPAETEERIGYNNPKNPRFNEKLSGETETKETPFNEKETPILDERDTIETLEDIEEKYEDLTLDVFEKGNVLSLGRIVIPEGKRGEGVGSNVMQDLIDYADKNNLKIILTPSTDFGATSVARLNKFYKKFGFIDNRGKNRDFSHKESMYRVPEESKQEGQVKPDEATTEETGKNLEEKFSEIAEDESPYIGMFAKPSESKWRREIMDKLEGGGGYFFFQKDKKHKVEMMSPDEYLSRVREGFGSSVDEGVNETSINKIEEGIERGDKIDPIYLDYRGGKFQQEGRNRATVAKKRGEKSIPVFIIEDVTSEERANRIESITDEAISAVGNDKTKIHRYLFDVKNLHNDAIRAVEISDYFKKTTEKKQESQVQPDEATTESKDVVTPEILEQGKKEVTDVTKGTFSTANPVKIFKGIGGKKDLQGFRINAHKGAKGVFSSVDSELAATYGRDEGVAEVVIPKGTSIEVVEVDGTGMGMSDYRAAEVKAINNSDAQIVKLITIDGVMKAGEKRQQQYVIKDDSLIEGLKKEESPTSTKDDIESIPLKKLTPNEEVQAKPDVVDTKSEKEAPIEKEESPRLEIDLDESTKSWVPKKLNSALEGIRVGLQDRWYRLRKTIRLARKAGAVISDEIDAYTKRELQSGKVSEKVTKFKELIIKSKPNQKNALLEDMQEDGVTNLDEFGLFLYAQHAPERNQTLKDRAVEEGREDTEGLSGMTNEQAQEIIESMPKDKLAKYKEYAKRFREEVILPSIDELENSELINSELANTLRTKWKNYVPLMVEEFVSDKAKYPSPKFSVRGKDIYKAKGSNFYDNKSRVNPFISGIERYINYASRAEENRTFQSLVGLAEKINNPDILKVIRPKYEPVRDTDGNTVYVRRKFENEAGKNLVEGKIDGKPVLIEVVNKNLFDALENSTISLNKVEQVLNAVNSYLRAVNTLMNPEFIVRNFVRDIQTAFINISAEDAKGMAAQMVKNVPSAIRGIIDNQRGNETEWSKIYQELKDEGGDVSWLEANDLTKIKKDIDASIKRYDKSSTKRNLIRALESIGGGWNTSMKATEMATRVAAYKTAIDKGYSKQKAASLAKNLTVNFEKKGVYGNLINSLYLFANAGIQGSAVIFKAMSKKGVGGNRARALAGSIIGMSFLNAMINDWVDDDDEVDKLTEVDKERNMIFMLPNKERVTIPLPYGYNLLWVTGQLSYDMASGNKTAGDAMASFLRAFDGAFNPLSSGNLGQMFTPTIAKPFVQAATNRNYKDAPIKPEDRPFSPKLKESSKFFKTARGSSKAVTDYLNKVSGGTEVVSGKVDISPEIIDHYIDFLGGGLGRFVANSVDIPYKIATGEDISTNNIPFARIFYRTPSSGRDLQVIYRTIEDSYKTKYTDRQKQKFFNSLNSALEEQVITVDEYERFLDDFNKAEMIKSISESNPDLMLEDIKEILKD